MLNCTYLIFNILYNLHFFTKVVLNILDSDRSDECIVPIYNDVYFFSVYNQHFGIKNV